MPPKDILVGTQFLNPIYDLNSQKKCKQKERERESESERERERERQKGARKLNGGA